MGKDLLLEMELLEKMVSLFCREKHGGKDLCVPCSDLLLFAAGRLAKCPHHPKPSCRGCRTHCFPQEQRGRVLEVMKHSAPRLLFRHPILLLRHHLR
jgi:hypothetical protein